MPTLSEKRMIQRRRASGILVPMLEELAASGISLSPETEKDAEWMHKLLSKCAMREQERITRNVIGPSALASCLRLVYLKRNYKSLKIEPLKRIRTEAIGFFAKGNFTHLQWQFALYRLSQHNSNFCLLDVDGIEPYGMEVYVASKRKDHGGTIDVVAEINGEPEIIDIKGWNIRWFQNAVHGQLPDSARIQITDYCILANQSRILGDSRKFKRGIVLVESKGGGTGQHPLALCEVGVSLKENKSEVKARIQILREHEAKKEIPPPECQSTGSIDFQGCPFSAYCRKEVKEIEARRKVASGNPLKVARPAKRGVNRTRGARSK